MKKPGVYIEEKNAFPNSVVEVATAVPAFIGYTEKAINGKQSLLNIPWRITSLQEFISFFGDAPTAIFGIKPKNETSEGLTHSQKDHEDISLDITDYTIEQTSTRYLLPHSMKLFFQNGGGPCYIVSVGDFDSDMKAEHFTQAIDILRKEQEPTMIVMPDLMNLPEAKDAYLVQNYALDHCGDRMQNRITILDIYGSDEEGSLVLDNFRKGIISEALSWGAAYYPWLNTSVVSRGSLSSVNINEESRPLLKQILTQELNKSNIKEERKSEMQQTINAIGKAGAEEGTESEMNHKVLMVSSLLYRSIIEAIHDHINLLPPSAAMAGLYTMVDNSRGVWKAPANVSLNSVISPSLNISNHEIEELSNHNKGKSVNAIRSFVGEGTLVWGACTLDGNSPEWKYINVRRTMIMLEQSIKLAINAYVFESNDANTWVTIKGMIRNYLTGVWKRGGLAGATPDDAYSVRVGLGETMTAHDISEGILRVSVLVAMTRPGEFTEITFQQKMIQSNEPKILPT